MTEQTTTRVSVSSFDVSILDTFRNPEAEEAAKLAPAKRGVQAAERTEFMLALDEKNKTLHAAWENAGSPDKWENVPTSAIGTILVPEDQRKVIARVIYNSARFVGFSASFGSKDAKSRDGRAVISWYVNNFTPRAKKNGGTE